MFDEEQKHDIQKNIQQILLRKFSYVPCFFSVPSFLKNIFVKRQSINIHIFMC